MLLTYLCFVNPIDTWYQSPIGGVQSVTWDNQKASMKLVVMFVIVAFLYHGGRGGGNNSCKINDPSQKCVALVVLYLHEYS